MFQLMKQDTLLNIVDEMKSIFEMLENTDGNIEEELINQIEQIDLELTKKVDNIAKYIKCSNYEIDKYKSLEKMFADKKKRIENVVENLKAYTKFCLNRAGLDKVNCEIFKVSLQNTTSSLIISDESIIPDEYKIIRFDIDKDKLKKDLKEGKEIPGAKLEQHKALVIR